MTILRKSCPRGHQYATTATSARRHQLGALFVTLTLALAGCARTQTPASRTPTDSESATPIEPSPAAGDSAQLADHLDHAAMLATIEWLADDQRRGRYTLSPEIEEAAAWLRSQYVAAGIAPVGHTYRHDFEVLVGASSETSPTFAILGGPRKRRDELASDALSIRAEGGSGQVSGPLTFVGYAGLGDPPTDHASSDNSDDKAGVPYDALAGVELTGRVALLLEGRPGLPDRRSIARAMEAVAHEHQQALKKLRERHGLSDDPNALPDSQRKRQSYTHKLAELESAAREAVIQTFAHHVDTTGLKAEFADQALDFAALEREMWRHWTLQRSSHFSWRSHRLSSKLERLKAAGAAGVILVAGPNSKSPLDPEASGAETLPELDDTGVVRSPVDLPVLQVASRDAQRLLARHGFDLAAAQAEIDRTGRPHTRNIEAVNVEFTTEFHRGQVQVPNILATIPGTDLANEIVVLGAHYDHIGDHVSGDCQAQRDAGGQVMDGICNGADDNASGTALLVELARTMAREHIRPRRTIVFMHFAGEELGLLGSSALVNNSPVPLDKVVAMLNVDMIGRMRDEGLSISGLATSPGWRSLIDATGSQGLPLLLDGAITSRSDHVGFYRRKIPVLFFFTGVHDDYHQPTDESSRINIAGMAKISTLIAGMVEGLAFGAPIAWSEPDKVHQLAPALPGENEASILERIPGTVPHALPAARR